VTLRIPNLNSFLGGIQKHIDSSASDVERLRQEVAEALLEELFKNIPVWSGRTVGSIRVSNTAQAPAKENHPDRGNKSKDGFYRYHPEYGFTNRMSLGSEPMRPSAEGKARATVDAADYSMKKRVYVVGNSTAWELVEKGAAPDFDPHRPRNAGIVSVIAVNATKAKFAGRGVK
jgi:hypothetical protein